MNRIVAFALAVVLGACLTNGAMAERRVALVIGNSAYAKVSALTNPENDAVVLADTLSAAGFDEVQLALDADYSKMRRVLGEFARTADGADIALLYFAGHGIEVGGANFLIPTDARLDHVDDVEFEAIALTTAMRSLNRAGKLKLVILDACRNNPFVPSMESDDASRSVGRGLTRVTPRSGDSLVAYAAREGTLASDGDGTHSPYAAALIKHIGTAGLDVRLLFGRVRDEVLEATGGRQEPFTYGSLGGSELFLTPPTASDQGGGTSGAVPPVVQQTDPAAEAWEVIEDSTKASDFAAFIDAFPNSFYARLAASRLADLKPAPQVAALAPTEQKAVSTGGNGTAKACFVYVGPSTDGGWSQAHDNGRKALERQFGNRVETAFVENVSEGPSAVQVFERFADSGCDIIFGTSFGYMDPIQSVAAKFPNVKFEHATGYKTANNVSTYSARTYEGRYLSGQIAARMSKSGIGGYVASFPIPEVVAGINAFALGAQSVNPDFELKVVWANTWYDPGKEKDAAAALFDQGADVIIQHTDSVAPLQVAEARGLHGFGQSRDMSDAAPNAHFTAVVDNWGAYYVKRVQAVLNGTWRSQSAFEGFEEGVQGMAAYTNLPRSVIAQAQATQQRLVAGDLHPFAGPIRKQDGSLAVADGETLSDAEILSMNWYVRGVTGGV